MEIWAHRGRTSPEDPGNNLLSFVKLESTGIEGIETDIAFDLRGKIMVYHPGINKPLLELDLFLDWFSGHSNKKCLLELKQNSVKLLRQIVVAITERSLQNRIYLTAFQRKRRVFGTESDGQLLILAKKFHPEIKTHLIVMWPYDLKKITDIYKPDIISLGWLLEPAWLRFVSKTCFKILTGTRSLKEQIERTRKADIKVLAGITNEPLDMFYFWELGVNGIVTDDPLLALKLKERPDCF